MRELLTAHLFYHYSVPSEFRLKQPCQKKGASLLVNGKEAQIGFNIVLSHDVFVFFSQFEAAMFLHFGKLDVSCIRFSAHISQRWSWETSRRPLPSWTSRLQISASGGVFVIQRSVSKTLSFMLIKAALLVVTAILFLMFNVDFFEEKPWKWYPTWQYNIFSPTGKHHQLVVYIFARYMLGEDQARFYLSIFQLRWIFARYFWGRCPRFRFG